MLNLDRLNELKNSVKELTESGLPFMEGREKGEQKDLIGSIVNVNAFGFLEGNDGKFLAFTVKEDNGRFFFGGGVATETFDKLTEIASIEEINQLLEEGIPVKFTEKMSKNKRKYTKIELYPNS